MTYIALFKPYGVLSQFTKEKGSDRETLASCQLPPDVYPVGRLDADSEGLLILTDDKRLNNSLLDPEHGHARTYLVQVENIPSDEALRSLEKGVEVKGRRTRKAKARLAEPPAELGERNPPVRFRKSIPTAWIELTLTEGRNRQVRRMTARVGHPTLRLLRSAIGRLNLFELELSPGDWRPLGAGELLKVFSP